MTIQHSVQIDRVLLHVGYPKAGGFDALWNAEVLAQMFPGARVLMVVREQRTMALSSYAQYVEEGGLLLVEGFLLGRATGKMPTFDLRFFDYHKLVALYRRGRGAECCPGGA